MGDKAHMSDTRKTIDITYAKNALFIRKSVAVVFGVPLDQELTWDFLQDRLCSSTEVAMPNCVLIRGMPSATGELEDESRMLRVFLRALEDARGVKVRFALHD